MNSTLFKLYLYIFSRHGPKGQPTFSSYSRSHFRVRNVTRFQNANRMSTVSPLSEIRLCPFDPAFKTNSQYICYKYEKCCRQGCCSNYGLSYYQSWTFWMIMAIIFGIFYLGSWYCKRVEMEHKRRLRTARNASRSAPSSTNGSAQVSPRRRASDGNVDHLLDYLIQSYRLQNISETVAVPSRHNAGLEPPPKYQEALSMPKRVRSNVQVVQIHLNQLPTSQPQNLASSSEIPPTYEDAVQNSNSTSTGNKDS